MIDIAALLERAEAGNDSVVFDGEGVIDQEPAAYPDLGPALLVASPVHDAVKWVVEERVEGSLDRDRLWSVHHFALRREVLLALEPISVTPSDLITEVRSAGFEWVVLAPDVPG